MISHIIVLLFCSVTLTSANQVYFEEKGQIAGNVGYFESAFTFNLASERQALEEIQTLTSKFLNSPEVKEFKDTCPSKKWEKFEDKLNKRNDQLEIEFRSIFHFGGVGTMSEEEHNIVERDFGITGLVFLVSVIVATAGTAFGIAKALESKDMEGMKSAITDVAVRSDQMVEHTDAQDDKINELRDSLKVNYFSITMRRNMR